jgi:hypothetical protein
MNIRPAEHLYPKKETKDMSHIKKPIGRLSKAPEPPLSYPGASADRDRARQPALSEPPCNDQPLVPGDRVEGRGKFGKLTGEFGTVERTNEDDALVKWDHGGHERLRQPWLKKLPPHKSPDATSS